MKFIGRQRELESLEREYQKDSSFVVIYGRRRVGKTTLIKEFIKGKLAFYFLATEEVESQSIKRLSGVVSRVTQNPLLQRAAFSDWLDSVSYTHLTELLGNGGQRVFHGAVRLALNEDVAPLMKYPVGDLHLQRVDGAGQVGIDQFRLVHKCLEVGLHRLIDVGRCV